MDVDELYGLPLERFVPERALLARQLRSSRRRDEAAAVTTLRKPSVAAWAVNQLVRTQRQAVDELFAAGDALRAAQSDVLAGHGEARALRAGGEQVRRALDELTGKARGLLSSAGHELSPATLERVSETLRAAALDDDARGLAGQGRLERELRHVGLGVSGDAIPVPDRPASTSTPKPKPKPKPKPAPTPAPTPTPSVSRERSATAERAALRRQQARKQARADERQARREVDRTERAVRAAEQRRERAAETLREADEALAQARTDGNAAVDAHRRAQEHLEAE